MTDAEKIKKLTALVRSSEINRAITGSSVYCGVCNTRGKTETHKPDCVLAGTAPAAS